MYSIYMHFIINFFNFVTESPLSLAAKKTFKNCSDYFWLGFQIDVVKINIILWMYSFVKIQRFERIIEVRNPSMTGREQKLFKSFPLAKYFQSIDLRDKVRHL